MFRTICTLTFVLFCATYSVYADKFEDARICMKTLSYKATFVKCCDHPVIPDIVDHQIKENQDMTCEIAGEMTDMLGLIENGEMAQDRFVAALESYEKISPELREMVTVLRKACSKGKFEHKFPEDICLPLKFHTCLFANFVSLCPKWKETDECMEVVGIQDKCEEILAK